MSDRLKSTAQELLLALAKQLVFSRLNVRRQSLTLHQTSRRFRQVITQPDWDTGTEHDAIAFKVDCHGIILHGIGMFLSAQAKGRRIVSSIEVFEAKTNANGESWTLISRTNGLTTNDAASCSKPAEVDNCTALFRLSKPVQLKPNIVYAVRIQIDAGKTYYGESGVAVLQLKQHYGRISFMPCASLRYANYKKNVCTESSLLSRESRK